VSTVQQHHMGANGAVQVTLLLLWGYAWASSNNMCMPCRGSASEARQGSISTLRTRVHCCHRLVHCTRLFVLLQAKTSIPGLGKPITAVDVTYDGRWILATTDDYLMVVKTCFDDDGKPGWEGADTHGLYTSSFSERGGSTLGVCRGCCAESLGTSCWASMQ
jgi:hypothetical protein